MTLDSTSYSIVDPLFRKGSNKVPNCGIGNDLPKNPYVFQVKAYKEPKKYSILTLWYNPAGRLLPDSQLIHNAKGIYHDLVEEKHGGLFLGNRRLDIEQYNGLDRKPTVQEHLEHLPDQLEDTIEPSTSTLIQEEAKPSIFTLFDLTNPEDDQIKTPSPTTPKK